jgi:Domain of Unknown Function (DUF1206)
VEAYADVRTRPHGGWEEPLARAGLVAKGASYAIVGVLALKLALGDGGRATSRQGALQELAGTTFGTVLLILLALGLASYAAWRFIQAWKGDKPTKRLGWAARGFVYAGLTYSAARILVGSGGQQQSQNGKAHKTTAVVLAWPGGVWIVGIAGAVVAAVGLWQLYTGISRRFEEKWRGYSKWGSRAGVVGHIARFVVFGLIAWFVIKAAVDYNPQDAIGLDGALQKLAHASYGSYLLGLTAAGLLAYAFYCLVDARYRDPSR